MIPRLHLPLIEPEDVIRHLAKEERHWKEGRSAHALTTVWFRQNALPTAVRSIFESHPVFDGAELIDGFLERKVDIGSPGRPSQTDLLAIIAINKQIAIIAVEGKAGETFGSFVSDWLDGSNTKLARLEVLCRTLDITPEEAKPLRYQLLHRAASAIFETKRYRTNLAGMLVHSFSDDPSGFSDFSAFLRVLGCNTPIPGSLLGPFNCDGLSLYAGWVKDQAPMAISPSAYLDILRQYAVNQALRYDRVRSWCDERKAILSGPPDT